MRNLHIGTIEHLKGVGLPFPISAIAALREVFYYYFSSADIRSTHSAAVEEPSQCRYIAKEISRTSHRGTIGEIRDAAQLHGGCGGYSMQHLKPVS